MGLKDKIKAEIANIKAGYPEGHKSWGHQERRSLPWPQRTPEEEQKHQKEKEHKEQFKHQEQVAFQTAYRKARITGAKRRGRQAGLAQGGRGHGIGSALGTMSKGMSQAGDFGLQMQGNLGNLFGTTTSPRTQSTRHKKKKPDQPEKSIWDFP